MLRTKQALEDSGMWVQPGLAERILREIGVEVRTNKDTADRSSASRILPLDSSLDLPPASIHRKAGLDGPLNAKGSNSVCCLILPLQREHSCPGYIF